MAEFATDGDVRFSRGSNSWSDPVTLPQESYAFTVNMLARGGIPQARPGFESEVTFPDGLLQGAEVYYPVRGLPQIICVVSGQLYASDYPYRSFRTVGGIKLSATAANVYLEQTLKCVERGADGSLSFVPPRALLMLQDGVSPACYYDGSTVQQVTGDWRTPLGTHMKWAGGRLWVSRGSIIFVGDIGDPLCFYEQRYNTLGGLNTYVLPGNCTGFALTSGSQSPQMLAFTATTTTMFRSDIRDRSSWPDIPDFQHLLLPGVGCVAHRSPFLQVGLLWWYSQYGWTNLDTAALTMHSTKVHYIDNEMVRSKSRLSKDLSGICATGHENLLLVSVPHASKNNAHTWVLDTATLDLVTQEAPPAWSGVWTGVQPVQWLPVTIGGTTTLYCVSNDSDKKNRLYRSFCAEQRDNGVDFPWRFESRGYGFQTPDLKHFRFMSYWLSELSGQVDIKFSWAGAERGQWKPFATVSFKAQEGNLDAKKTFDADTLLFGLKKQSRKARTEDVMNLKEDALSSAGVEGQVFSIEPNEEHVDTCFQIAVEGTGSCAIRGLQLFAEVKGPPKTGQAIKPEGDDRFVRFDGAASNDEQALQEFPVAYAATKRYEARYGNYVAAATGAVSSRISQADADKRAFQLAAARADRKLQQIVPPIQGGSALP